MGNNKVIDLKKQEEESKSALERLISEGARRMLKEALEVEVAEYIEKHAHLRDGNGRLVVVRNGSLPERELVTGVGPLEIKPNLPPAESGEGAWLRGIPGIWDFTVVTTDSGNPRREVSEFPTVPHREWCGYRASVR